MELKNMFEAKIHPQDLWKNEDGSYGNPTVQYAWMVARSLYAEMANLSLVSQLADYGEEGLKAQCVKILLDEESRIGLKRYHLAEKLNIPGGQLSNILNQKASVSLGRLIALVKVARMQPSQANTVVTRRNDAELGLTQGEANADNIGPL